MLFKCKECNSCLQYAWLYGQLHLYCSLCKIVYKAYPGRQIRQVEDQETIAQIVALMGTKV